MPLKKKKKKVHQTGYLVVNNLWCPRGRQATVDAPCTRVEFRSRETQSWMVTIKDSERMCSLRFLRGKKWGTRGRKRWQRWRFQPQAPCVIFSSLRPSRVHGPTPCPWRQRTTRTSTGGWHARFSRAHVFRYRPGDNGRLPTLALTHSPHLGDTRLFHHVFKPL